MGNVNMEAKQIHDRTETGKKQSVADHLKALDAIASAIEGLPTFTSDDRAFLEELPAFPSEDGTRVLMATTSGGVTNLSYGEAGGSSNIMPLYDSKIVHHNSSNNATASTGSITGSYTATSKGKYLILAGGAYMDGSISISDTITVNGDIVTTETLSTGSNKYALKGAILDINVSDVVAYTISGGGYGSGLLSAIISLPDGVSNFSVLASRYDQDTDIKTPVKATPEIDQYILALFCVRGEKTWGWQYAANNGLSVASPYLKKTNVSGWAQNIGVTCLGVSKGCEAISCGGMYVGGSSSTTCETNILIGLS